jgi:hypothetical protein
MMATAIKVVSPATEMPTLSKATIPATTRYRHHVWLTESSAGMICIANGFAIVRTKLGS